MEKYRCKMFLGYHVNISLCKGDYLIRETHCTKMKSNKGFLGRTWMRGGSFSKNENKGKGRFPPLTVQTKFSDAESRFGDSTE